MPGLPMIAPSTAMRISNGTGGNGCPTGYRQAPARRGPGGASKIRSGSEENRSRTSATGDRHRRIKNDHQGARRRRQVRFLNVPSRSRATNRGRISGFGSPGYRKSFSGKTANGQLRTDVFPGPGNETGECVFLPRIRPVDILHQGDGAFTLACFDQRDKPVVFLAVPLFPGLDIPQAGEVVEPLFSWA